MNSMFHKLIAIYAFQYLLTSYLNPITLHVCTSSPMLLCVRVIITWNEKQTESLARSYGNNYATRWFLRGVSTKLIINVLNYCPITIAETYLTELLQVYIIWIHVLLRMPSERCMPANRLYCGAHNSFHYRSALYPTGLYIPCYTWIMS